VRIPEGIQDGKIRSRLLEKYNIEIASGLGELKGKGLADRINGLLINPGEYCSSGCYQAVAQLGFDIKKRFKEGRACSAVQDQRLGETSHLYTPRRH
jgi:aspartate aminotransferase-like enzyme